MYTEELFRKKYVLKILHFAVNNLVDRNIERLCGSTISLPSWFCSFST